ncbi:uncharacterized protein E0L32_005839 [Thyridium curvatum]|uniref:WSC domain-containing protein n=1 Tax=Thyridium curvatum TaxID=1093900 RepID=A0A507B3J3_9PEZI|nr:uncharacterized protein E0L32_005839 [Thyridium curvatum]TPX13636.1 hypothetical protein E0L32_005839 [Thyridium curvatum]
MLTGYLSVLQDQVLSGYLPNHNINPDLAASSDFKNLWTFTSPDNKELHLAKPLIYTPAGSPELVITASEMNNVRIFNSKTGAIIKQRQLQPPFSSGDSNCGDINPWVGVTGTPIIDANTDIMYLFSKGYKDGFTSGTANGIYKMYAIRIPTLEDVEGFPVVIDGHNADNDHARYFVAGVALQRPALTELNGHIVAGFGSHCSRWNYTGYLISVSKTPGVGVSGMFATESAPGAPKPQPLDLAVENGGKAGIWQAGFGLPTMGNNIFFVTGNGQGHQNGNIPANGRLPMSTLDESIVRMEMLEDGKFKLIDYFQPYDYIGLDAGDRDVGSSGLCTLDGSVFNGAGVSRMGVVAGKEGRAYIVNLDNLGGFRQGANGGDATVQTIELGGSLFGGFGSYPAEGGYIYATTVGGPLRAWKLGHDGAGKPVFSLAGTSQWISAGRVGVGQMTITSDNGKQGTGIVWVTDPNEGLVAFRAVPQDGVMVRINTPKIQGANKFQRPAFGNGRVFVSSNVNKLYAVGSNVASALNCTDPVSFGDVSAGSVATATVTCKAVTQISAIKGCSPADSSFRCDNSTLPQGAVASGTTFTFPVTWDLQTPGSSIKPGFVSSSLTISLTASGGYASTVAVPVQGNIVSKGPFLTTTPTEVDFGRMLKTDGPMPGLTAATVLQNAGNGTLTFIGAASQDTQGNYVNITSAGQLGSGFSSSNFPTKDQTLAAGQSITLSLAFNGNAIGNYSTRVTVWSDGGVSIITLKAFIANPPVVTFDISDGAGGWQALENYKFSFGDVVGGTTVQRQLRVCNSGGSNLIISISKPPSSVHLLALNPTTDLYEGTQIEPGKCSAGTVAVIPGTIQPNHPARTITDAWAIGSDGLDPVTGQPSGRHDITFTARLVSRQVGPKLADGSARYQYVGCFADTKFGRNLANSVNSKEQADKNTVEQCEQLCMDRGFAIAGLQYHRECWCGNSFKYPQSLSNENENLCTFDCTGDDTEACGGDGGYMSAYADVTKFDIPGFLAGVNNGTTSSSSSVAPSSTSSSTTSGISSTVSSTVSTTSSSSTASSSSVSSSSVTSSTSGSSSVSPSPTSTGSPLNPSQPPTVADRWVYAGCYQDLVDDVRVLSAASTASDDMTIDKCAAFCTSGAYNGGAFNFFGLEYGRECYCGWQVDASLAAPESECPSACAGSSVGLCGGGKRLSVWRNSVPNKVPSDPVHVQRSGPYRWMGCRTEGTNGRALKGKSYAADTVDVDACSTFCAAGSFTYMGVEYGRECYCGNDIGAGVKEAPTSECKTLCKGNRQTGLLHLCSPRVIGHIQLYE